MKGGPERQEVSAIKLKETHEDLWHELQRALKKHSPGKFASPHEALGCITEEYHELVAATISDKRTDFVDELMDLAVLGLFAAACFENRGMKAIRTRLEKPSLSYHFRYRGYHIVGYTYRNELHLYDKGLLRWNRYLGVFKTEAEAKEAVDKRESGNHGSGNREVPGAPGGGTSGSG